MSQPIQIQLLRPGIKVPQPATDGSAGYDLQASIDTPITLWAGQSALIPTGLKVFTNDKNVGCFIIPKSGKGNKGFGVKNMVGLIDSDYQGELFVGVINTNLYPEEKGCEITINPLEPFAQMYFGPVIHRPMMVVTEFTKSTERGEKGFGQATESRNKLESSIILKDQKDCKRCGNRFYTNCEADYCDSCLMMVIPAHRKNENDYR